MILKTKNKLILCIISTMMLVFCTSVYANNTTLEINSNKNKISNAEEIVLTLKLDSMQEKIYTYKAKLVYDENIFEKVTIDNFETCNNWENIKYNESTGEFIAICSSGSNGNEDVLKIKLVCKCEEKNKTTDISISNFLVENLSTNKETTISTLETVNIQINIIDEEQPKEDESQPDKPSEEEKPNDEEQQKDNEQPKDEEQQETPQDKANNEEKDINTNSNNKTKNTNSQNNTTQSKLPQTGDNNYIILVTALSLGVTLIITVIVRKKLTRKMLSILLVLTLISPTILTSVNVKAAEIDSQAKEEYINLLEEYLIGLNSLNETEIKNLDIYENGELDLVDLSYLIQLEPSEKQLEEEVNLKATNLGIGGGGMLYSPTISPFDINTMMVTSDMGGIYVSHNAGQDWVRKNLKGTAHKTYFDPNREGVLYAGGSGLYRSTDNGENFKLIFPNEDDIIQRVYKEESGMQYLFTKSKVYPTYKMVKDILVNPNDSDDIYVLMYYGKEGIVYESTDNGDTFAPVFTYTKQSSTYDFYYDYNQLLYDRNTNTIYCAVDEGIFTYNKETKTAEKIYNSSLGIIEIAQVYENEKTKFIVIENSEEIAGCDTKVFITEDFVTKTDITQEIIKDLPTSFDSGNYTNIQYNWNFTHISATSTKNIYLTQDSYSNNTDFAYGIQGVIRFNNGYGTWIYGNPYKDQWSLENRGWIDGNYRNFGITVSTQNEDTILFTTLCGVYYSPDSTKIYQRYCKVINDSDTTRYVTNGIDEQTTYGVAVDPFNKNNILLLNTDLGLIRSKDNGQSWVRANTGVKYSWTNTAYDAEFDKYTEGVVYSLWSSRHNAPYTAGNETDGKYGGFAISYDGGKTWDSTYSSGLPENAIPVKLSIVYPEDSTSERTIYVATFNEGFFVSYDSGKTFSSINEGINKVSYYKDGVEKYQYIFAADVEAKDGRVFGLTAKTTYNGETQAGEVFELINGKWEKIELGENVKIPRDIYYNEGTLYISATAIVKYDYKTPGVDFSDYGGGIYTYENGNVTQIFDETISATGVQIDSNGVLYASDIHGNIYRKEQGGDYVKIYDSYFSISKGIQLTDDDTIYLASFGGGVLRIEGLKQLQKQSEEITEEDTSFKGYTFNQVTPTDKKVTYNRIIMTREEMSEFGTTGAGSQWPVSLEASSDGSLMLLGIDVAGLYKSTDHGKTWEPANSGITSRGVGMFAIDPYNANHVLALGLNTRSSVGGIHISYDGTETWERTFPFAVKGERYLWDGLEFDGTSYDEEIGYTMDVYFSTPYERDTDIRTSVKEEPKSLSPLTEEQVGLYKSQDGGKTFELIINDKRVADGIVRITDNGKVFVGNQYGLFLINKDQCSIEEIYLENDPSVDYTKGITGLDVVGNTIYAQTWDGIYTLTADGTLTMITNDTYHSTKWPQFLEVSSSNPDHMIYQYRADVNNYYVNDIAVSYDGGKTWQKAYVETNSTYYKVNGRSREKVFIIDSSNDNNVLTLGGDIVLRSEDGGLNFIQANGVSNTMQGGRFNFNYYNPDLLVLSAQDYTGSITTNGGTTYSTLKIPGKGNFYGGFAADEDTIYGFANKSWYRRNTYCIT